MVVNIIFIKKCVYMNPSCGCGEKANINDINYATWQNEVDTAFMTLISQEVTQTCALPMAVPLERIPALILQAARWFWQNDDWSLEERMYAIPNKEICKGVGKGQGLNKIVQLPQQVMAVWGVYKRQSAMAYGAMGDFSLERMMLSTYSMFGGVGAIGAGLGPGNGYGYTLPEVVATMYEIDTFDQILNPPVTFNFNQFSHKLVLLGAVGGSDILIQTFIRCRIQDLYDNYYFQRFVVCLVKKSLSTIYGSFEFKYPGGVTINYSMFSDEADNELESIKEEVKSHRGSAILMQPNTI